MLTKYCMLGYKMAAFKFRLQHFEKCQMFYHNFQSSIVWGRKQVVAKIRSHICGTCSWHQPVCIFIKILINQYHVQKGLIGTYFLSPSLEIYHVTYPTIHLLVSWDM